MRVPRCVLLACACALGLALPAAASAARPPVEVQLLAVNDFHGALEPPAGSAGRIGTVDAGGVEYLASHVRALEAQNPRTVVVSAGDLIGASPLLSALFHDEPTIEAMNLLGLDLNAVGNHEFDEGAEELLRMAEGGCHPTEGCLDGDGFRGADFGFLAANVVSADTGEPLFEPYAIKRFRRVKVGFIGMTLEGTPDIVSPSGIQGLRFLDEAATANRYARELRRRHGVQAIVVLLHEGGFAAGTGENDCTGISGPIVDIVQRTARAVDLFITGHTHQAYNCVIDGRRVTSAASNGRLITDIDLSIDRRTKDVVAIRANNAIVTRSEAMRAPDLTALIQRYQTLAAPLSNRVIGRIAGDITRTFDDSRENAAGNLIADAQLAATDDPSTGGAVAAFMNPGGVRADFIHGAIAGGEAPGELTYGESFTVQPFGNNLTTITLTGAQLLDALKQQWCGGASARVLLPSATVSYTYDQSVAAAITGRPCEGAENPVSDLRIGGVAVDPAQSYRITVNSFLADGGDAFSVFRAGTDRLGGVVDTDALQAYLEPTLAPGAAPIAAPALDRIDVVP